MMRLLTILFLFLYGTLNAQFGQPRPPLADGGPVNPCPIPPCPVVNIVMPAIDPNTDFSRPNGSTWNENSGAQIVAGLPPPKNYYRRFTWADLEDNNTPGLWKFDGRFRSKIEDAIDLGQTFSFGIMQLYPEGCGESFSDMYTYGGFCATYPQYVHNLMNASGTPDFNDGTSWIPNYNHPQWLARWDALNVAVNSWLNTASYTPSSGPKAGQLVIFKDIISYVDVRGYGSYGEWHHCCLGNGYDVISNWPAGRFGTVATMKRIIDITADAYTNYPVCIIINSLDGGFDNGNGFNNTKIPVEVGIYALTKTNTFGKIGLRRDQWGDNSSYYNTILQGNTMTFGGVRADTAILNRYKYSIITGEPPGYNCNNSAAVCRNGVNMGWIPEQAQTLHAYNIGNGNWGGNAPTNVSSVDSIKKAWRLMGSRVLVTGGTMTDVLQASTSFNVTFAIRNIGLATEHRAYTTQIVLKNSGGTTVFTGTHSFQVKGFNTSASSTNFSTNFNLGAITPGTGFNLYVQLVDPLNYVQPYPLGNTGGVSGQYLVRSNITVIAGP